MSCEEYRQRLDLYLDEELEGEDAAELEAHFSECPACFEYVRGVRAFRARLRQADGEVSLPAGLRPAVMRELNRSDRRVFLEADKDVSYGFVVNVMSEIKGAGVEKLGMLTKPKETENE